MAIWFGKDMNAANLSSWGTRNRTLSMLLAVFGETESLDAFVAGFQESNTSIHHLHMAGVRTTFRSNAGTHARRLENQLS